MTKLKISKNGRQGCEITYWNPKGQKTPEGEVAKVVVLINTDTDGSIRSYEITYREGSFYLGGRKETVTELPKEIKLID